MGLRTNKVQMPETETQEPETETKKEETMTETKEVAVKPPADVVVAGERIAPSLMSLENKLNPEEFGNLFPRIVGSNGMVLVELPLGTSLMCSACLSLIAGWLHLLLTRAIRELRNSAVPLMMARISSTVKETPSRLRRMLSPFRRLLTPKVNLSS